MSHDTAREARLFALVALLIVGYGSTVTAVALSHGQLELIFMKEIGSAMAAIWITAFAFVFCAYAIDLMLRRRPDRPLLVMASEFRAQVLRPDWLIARGTVVAGWFCLMIFFTPFKVMIGHIQGFPLDAALANLDRAIFFGSDPWTWTHALFGSAPVTFALHMAYNLWFVMMWLSIIYFMMRPELVRLRARYLVAFLLSWMIVGSFAAYFLASAGPCFYERAFGDPQFRPLMDRLHMIDAELKAFYPAFGVHGLRLQDLLWGGFVAKRDLFGGGISAMPSMHVSLAVLMACAGWKLNRRLGWILTVFAGAIWIGSVHFGWHYATDGLVALGLTLGIWKVSGWLVDRLVMREAPAAAWRPALAE